MNAYVVRINNKNARGGVFSTPDKVIFEEPLVLNKKVWEWLMADVHLFSVREVEFE